jgi:hypothetical protein
VTVKPAHHPLALLSAFVAAALMQAANPAAAQTQTIWRCGADGRSYSAVPCSEGRLVASLDSRPAADLRAAQAVATRERRLAEQLHHERLQREAVAPGAGLAGIRQAQPAPPHPLKAKAAPRHHRLAQPQPEDADTWRAVAPASPRKRG